MVKQNLDVARCGASEDWRLTVPPGTRWVLCVVRMRERVSIHA